MRLRQISAALLPLWLATAGAFRLEGQCTPRAVLIGVSVYKDTSFTLLPHAREDAIAFRDWFQNNATCASGPQAAGKPVVRLLTDGQATQTAIMRELSTVLLTAGRDDEVFIFISARGIKTPDYGEGYLLGYDGMRGKLHPSGVSVQNLRDVLPSRGVGRVFFFADISRDLPNQNQIVSHLQGSLAGNPKLGAVLSAKPRQISSDAGGYPLGLFTHFLMEELKANRSKKVSLENLYQNLRRKVLEASKSKQEPVWFGDHSAIVELSPREQVLLAALGTPLRGVLAFQQQRPAPLPLAAEVIAGPLARAFDFEQQAQLVLLRYGEGNQFPDDPLRPGAADFERAAALFERALQTRPSLPVTELDDRLRTSLKARILFCRGRALIYSARYDEARKLLEESHAADPLLPEPDNAIGITYLEQARYEHAVESFRRSIRIAPDWAYPRHNLALTFIEMGDNTAAETEYRAAIRRTPDHPYLYYNLGILLERINRRKDAEQAFRDAILRFEQQAESYRDRAARLNAELADSAIAIQEAETVKRNEGEAYNALGALLQSQGKKKQSRQNYEKALSLNDKLYAAKYNLGNLALAEHYYAEAIRLLESVLQSNPSFPEASVKLDCARKWDQYSKTNDRPTQQRLRQELKPCLN
jgi:tetratricopeptide (TPR) repeat protein